MITVILNGHSRAFEALGNRATLEEIVHALELKGDRIAVEHNGEIVARAQWPCTEISNNDKLEIVHFVGGG